MNVDLAIALAFLAAHWVVAFLAGRDLRDRGASIRYGAGTVLLYLVFPPLGLLLWIAGMRRYPRRA